MVMLVAAGRGVVDSDQQRRLLSSEDKEVALEVGLPLAPPRVDHQPLRPQEALPLADLATRLLPSANRPQRRAPSVSHQLLRVPLAKQQHPQPLEAEDLHLGLHPAPQHSAAEGQEEEEHLAAHQAPLVSHLPLAAILSNNSRSSKRQPLAPLLDHRSPRLRLELPLQAALQALPRLHATKLHLTRTQAKSTSQPQASTRTSASIDPSGAPPSLRLRSTSPTSWPAAMSAQTSCASKPWRQPLRVAGKSTRLMRRRSLRSTMELWAGRWPIEMGRIGKQRRIVRRHSRL